MDELQVLRTRVGEMAAEIERLQGLIDETNAQEPIAYVDLSRVHDRDLPYACFTKVASSQSPVYARPIPAQQSPAVAVPESVDIDFIEDCLIAYRSGLYFDGAEGLRNRIDHQLSAIKQPSPRITE